jgi:hypothetical protein
MDDVLNKTQDPEKLNTIEMNHVFANRSEEDEIFPLTVKEIVEAQKADPILKHLKVAYAMKVSS